MRPRFKARVNHRLVYVVLVATHDELIDRDKASLDIFWLRDDSLDNLDDLPPPDVLQQEIIEHLEAALASFRDVAIGLLAN
jgi:type I restriction enzyme M protein